MRMRMARRCGSGGQARSLPAYPRRLVTFEAMQPPRIPALFSLFRQRGGRGFDYTPRYYDAAKEARHQRIQRAAGAEGQGPEAFRARMRHSWQRQGGEGASVMRLVVVMAMVCGILYFIIKGFGLLQHFAWPT